MNLKSQHRTAHKPPCLWNWTLHSLTKSPVIQLFDSLAPLVTHAHSSLSTAFCHCLLTFFSTDPFQYLPSQSRSSHSFSFSSAFLSNTFVTTLPRSILTSRPVDSSLFYWMSPTTSKSLCSFHISWSVLILHVPSSTTSPYIKQSH